jgi:hypothetical protein
MDYLCGSTTWYVSSLLSCLNLIEAFHSARANQARETLVRRVGPLSLSTVPLFIALDNLVRPHEAYQMLCATLILCSISPIAGRWPK